MRVLSISNLYPPHHLGGYELVHRDADDALRAAGHAVRTLVTDHREPGRSAEVPRTSAAREGTTEPAQPQLIGHPGPVGHPERDDHPEPVDHAETAGPGPVAPPSDVHRELRWYWRDHRFPRMRPRQVLELERHNRRALRRHLAEHRPDVVVFWALGGMSLSLVGAVRSAGLPAVFVVHDRWPIYGPRVDRFARALRPLGRAAGPVARRLGSDRPSGPEGTVLLSSLPLADELVRTRSIPPSWRVVPPGVVVPDAIADAPPWRGRLLCLGRLDPRKGIDVALDALTRLPDDHRLTVVGGGDDRVAAALREQAARAGLGSRLELRGPIDHAQLAALLAEHDALLFPVRWSEPFGLVPLEAMAHGLPVVATAGGGPAEYLDHERNALAVAPEDPDAVAAAVRRLAADLPLRERLRAGGRATAERFTVARFHDEVERAVRVAGRSNSRS